MGDAKFFSDKLLAAVKNGQVPQNLIDDKVLRVLTAMFTIGLFDNPSKGNLTTPANNPKYEALGEKGANRRILFSFFFFFLVL